MKAFLAFIIVLVILALFCWRGWKRGIVLTMVGIIVFGLAFAGGNLTAKKFSGQFSAAIVPLISSPVENAGRVAIGFDGRKSVDENGDEITLEPVVPEGYDGTVESAAYYNFIEIGFTEDASRRFAAQVAEETDTVGSEMYAAIAEKAAETAAFLLVFILAAVIIIIAACAIANLFNFNVEFPGHNKLNRIGGAVLGLFFGFVVLYGIGWILRFCGVFLGDLLDNTIVGKFTVHNPFTNMMGF